MALVKSKIIVFRRTSWSIFRYFHSNKCRTELLRNPHSFCRNFIFPVVDKRNFCLSCLRFKQTEPLTDFQKKKAENDAKPKGDRQLKHLPKVKKKVDVSRTITGWHGMTVQDLAKALDKTVDDIFEALLNTPQEKTYNNPDSMLDTETIHEIVKKFRYKIVMILPTDANKDTTKEDKLPLQPVDSKSMQKRPPVVTIMGHVDHGKTSLLDSLRHSSIVSQEFGGITQHIGAFSVKLVSGDTVTFLDTPGHAAFSAMRERGAMVTDIVVLVVAADDGVMEQTIQSIKYAEQAKVPIVVAINKIDKPTADIEKTKKGLLQEGIQLEDFGGEVQSVAISATKGTNIDGLVEVLLTQAELMELKADPKTLVQATVIESRVDPARGKLSTALIEHGTLRKGSYIVAGTSWAKVRSMFNDSGQTVSNATPGYPVEIIGWKQLPSAGDKIYEVLNEKQAKKFVDHHLGDERKEKELQDLKVISQKMDEHIKAYRAEREERFAKGRFRKSYAPQLSPYIDDDTPKLQIVMKGDVDGSVDAILDALESYNCPECKLDVIHFGVGDVLPTDVELAKLFNGQIYAFNVSTSSQAKGIAASSKLKIKHFNVIYKMIDDIKEEINSRLPLKDQEQILGEAEVLQEFLINEDKKKWPVAGSKCSKGELKKSAKFRLLRDNQSIHEGTLASLRHLKNEVNSVKKGVECGIRFEDLNVRFKLGDKIVCYEIVRVKQTTAWTPF